MFFASTTKKSILPFKAPKMGLVSAVRGVVNFSVILGMKQVRKYDPEWTIHVLDDLHAFFEANDMPVSSERTKGLIDAVKAEARAESQLASIVGRAPRKAS